MARADEFTKRMRSQLHKWGFAPMTSAEEDVLVQRVRDNKLFSVDAAVVVAERRIDIFRARNK